MNKITQEKVKSLFNYDDGKLIWKVRRQGINASHIAGCTDHEGYIKIGVDGKVYFGHHLVWLWHKGYLPENRIDHRDRKTGNNCIGNLREATQQCNLRNTGNRKNNTSGVKGVYWFERRQKWRTRITVAGKDYTLGYRTDFFEAVCLRLAAEQAEDWSGCDDCSPAYQHIKSAIPHIK